MIEINNLTANLVDENSFKKLAQKVLKGEGKEKSGLSIALIGQGRMRKLNKRYRGKNRVTDVLAFSENKIPNGARGSGRVAGGLESKFQIPKSLRGLGEIVICLREVKKNAKRFESTFKKELATCLIHGILHLLGYDHEISEEKAKEMGKKQKYYLSKVF
ncbi:rRNA maturation RNase YbeY [Patescibacteria group bacterium]|nr:rRNA maturation RNase YbeY [Patescibacteria group bacterium]